MVSKIRQKTPCTSKSSKRNSESNCYSITIRPGNGIDLGSLYISQVRSYLNSISEHCVLNLEKEGVEQHIQGGIFLREPLRQDKIREKILSFVLPMFTEQQAKLGKPSSTKQLENVAKFSVKVSSHNDFHTLVKYCMKDLSVCYVNQSDPYTLLEYKYVKKLWDLIEEIFYDRTMPNNIDPLFL